MRSLKSLAWAAALALSSVTFLGCGSADEQVQVIGWEDMTPEQQEQMRQREQEAARAAAAGEPIPADMITQEMLLGGMVDGVLVTPEQMQQIQQQEK
jgi:hypothetical protein